MTDEAEIILLLHIGQDLDQTWNIPNKLRFGCIDSSSIFKWPETINLEQIKTSKVTEIQRYVLDLFTENHFR